MPLSAALNDPKIALNGTPVKLLTTLKGETWTDSEERVLILRAESQTLVRSVKQHKQQLFL